ncbi:Hsp20/alpha crystallin family protein [Sulfurospirillum sp. 1612]|uniref:Hsp20/alpha crystallin family protein n=1 Tax=Sulfurospirillum sp. 1612 TaxID=3094835 RepID=UPI002F94BD24
MKTVNTALTIALLSGFLISANAQTNPSNPSSISSDFEHMEQTMGKLFRDLHQKYFGSHAITNPVTAAKSSFKNTRDAYVITVNLPGFEQSNIDIKTNKNMLYINARSYQKNVTKNQQNYQSSSYTNSYFRSFLLPNNAKMKEMKTQYKQGVLVIKIPKA